MSETNRSTMTFEQELAMKRRIKELEAQLTKKDAALLLMLEVLESSLPEIAHQPKCWKFNPVEEWETKGSGNFDGCSCKRKVVKAAIAAGREALKL